MKKIISLAFLILIILLNPGMIMAAGNNCSIDFDYLFSGDGSFNLVTGSGGDPEFKLTPSEYVLDVNFAVDRLVLGAEYANGSSKIRRDIVIPYDGTSFTDFNYYKVDCGFRAVNSKQATLDLLVSYFNYTGVDKSGGLRSLANSETINGLMFGTKINAYFSPQAYIQASYGTSVSINPKTDFLGGPTFTTAGYFTEYFVKFNYLLSDNFGASIGYRALTVDPTFDISGTHYDFKNMFNGFTGGFVFTF